MIESLFYSDIFFRQEQVEHVFDGIESIYEWIFDKSQTQRVSERNQTEEPYWNDFAAWLKSKHDLYWINGKAGSDKSTLMNYICQHNRKLKLLNDWTADRLLLTPAYFFWAAGSRQQKSIDNLLRSLIYQMLTECRELIECLKASSNQIAYEYCWSDLHRLNHCTPGTRVASLHFCLKLWSSRRFRSQFACLSMV